MIAEHTAILNRVSFCAQLPSATIAELAAIAVPFDYPPETIVFLEGDPIAAMYIVARGQVKITRIGANGREQVIEIALPGDHFNTITLFDDGPCPAHAQTLTETSLLMLPKEQLEGIIDKHPALARALLKEFAQRMRRLVSLIDDLALHSVQGRLARLILTTAAMGDQGQTPPQLTQAEMAARLGTVREVLGRSLKAFETAGLIHLEQGRIVVMDRDGLERQAER
ncbi:MAG: Crp/Fnr family transcriptional regulator [Chloroflexales bacterium]|nr:Crp/Fnr family transcriptional regulator [Chloroflexales bacterium]